MENLLGRIITVVLISVIFKFTIFSKNEEKRDGYIVASSIGFMNLSKILVILSCIFIIIIMIFGNFKSMKIILLFLILALLLGIFGYLFYKKKRVSFNEEIIEVESLFKKKRIYSYKDILYAKDILMDKVVVYTNSDKFSVDHELKNVDKFIEMLESKKINIEKKKLFEK